ncbi:MAG TPA: hypothetical protein VN836_06090 [Verrucomicrobiae bacterium]|nr:hypothetical protein [Verrucomicrobiae bacterium]
MPKKQWFLLAVAAVLAVVYVWYFTGWFQHKDIHISSTARAALPRFSVAGTSTTVAFALDTEYQLTEVKAVPLAAWQTNQAAMPVWHLAGDRKSAPTKFFLYGENINGMKPVVAGAKPGRLEDRVTYRLFVSAGSLKGQHDFWVGEKPPDGTNSAGR